VAIEIIISVICGLVLGGLAVFFIKRYQDETKKRSARIEAERIVNKAKSEATKIDKDSKNKAKDFESRARKNVEQEIQKQKMKLKHQESQLERRLKDVDDSFKKQVDEHDKTMQALKDKEDKISVADQQVREMEKKVQANINELKEKLQSVASMTDQEAKKELMKALEEEAKVEASHMIAKIEEQAQEEADKKAKRIVAQAMARYAGEYTSERTVSVLELPNDEMKGKIIGREGRNIRALESLCGVDLIIDDTPEAVVISCFDPIRREVAKRTLEKLMEDGRVHPARIEEVVDKVQSDMNKVLKEDGEKACLELGIPNLHVEILKVLGGLKYRSTHLQNGYVQAMEVGYIAGLLAAEVGANVKLARRAGLLHNIGMGVDHFAEGNFSAVGADFAKRFNEPEIVVEAIRVVHGDERATTLIPMIVQTAYLLSASRPGSRRPNMDNFIQRLHDLESIGNSFEGVVRTFAVQAGREVRVMVEASKVTEEQSAMLTRDIIKKIEREMPYSGTVRVAVIRETRAVEYAR
jgi:ribonuclease Y